MSAPKGQTLQQRLGFGDPELSTPQHDSIMMWLDSRMGTFVKENAPDPAEYEDGCEATLDKISTTWERPILSGKYMVGFADLQVSTRWRIDGPGRFYMDSLSFWFEVKPVIRSVGEVIRQIRMYQEYTEGEWFVVSPDTRWADVLAAQNIGFVPVPSGVIGG